MKMHYCMITLLLSLGLLLASCQAAPPTEDPMVAANTQMAKTLAAMETQIAKLSSTNTPSVTPTTQPTRAPTLALTPAKPVSTQPDIGGAAMTSFCDSFSFLSDVTIPDNVSIPPGSKFKKIWAVKNTGQCTWNSGYELVFTGGDQLGGPASKPALETGYFINPGEMALLSVELYAPPVEDDSRNYVSYWRLRNDKGQLFGWGEKADRSIYAAIKPLNYYSFIDNLCSGVWTSSAGALYCPGASNDPKGVYLLQDNPRLENGYPGGRSILLVPPQSQDAFLQVKFAPIVIPSGGALKGDWNCAYGETNCNFHAIITAAVEGGAESVIGEWFKYYDGFTQDITIPLKSFYGLSTSFTVKVDTNGGPEGDKILLRNPRVMVD